MEPLQTFAQKLIESMGFEDFRVELRDEKRGAIFIYDNPVLIKESLPVLVSSINLLIQLFSRKLDLPSIFFDINNYRQERENLISELARAAAKKVIATKAEVSLPAMNSYERRLVHVALAVHPEVTTESIGEGKERCVVIKLISNQPITNNQ